MRFLLLRLTPLAAASVSQACHCTAAAAWLAKHGGPLHGWLGASPAKAVTQNQTTMPFLTEENMCTPLHTAVKHDDPVHGWLGASPDGLIESLTLEAGPPLASSWDPAAAAARGSGAAAAPWDAAAAASGLPPGVAAAIATGRGPLAGPGRGILEIKCPHNKGQPELAVPPQHATWYYMPQVGGQGCGAGCKA